MDKKDSAVILDLRTLVGTANIFSKQDMYRVMYPGPSVDIKHFTLYTDDSFSLNGFYKLFVLTVSAPVTVTCNGNSFTVNKIFIYDDTIENIIVCGSNVTGTCLTLLSDSDNIGIVGKAIVGKSRVA